MLSGHLYALQDFFLGDVDNVEAVEVSDGYEHRLSIRTHNVRPGPTSRRDDRRIIHFLEINEINLVGTHRTDVDIPFTACVQGIVWFFDGQSLDNFLFDDIDDINLVSVANRDDNILSIWRSGNLVRPAADLHRSDSLSGFCINDP